MAVETKPLFNPELVRREVHSFTLPESAESALPCLQHWADLISSGKADTFKETALFPEFLTDIFGQLLGYTGPAGAGDSFTLLRETHVEVDGQFADAALGRFTSETKKFIVAVEGKGTRDPLERPFAGRRMSAVDQAYRYAINLPCDWIIVTSMQETRLYHKGSNQQTYERFETTRLASDAALRKRFVFLLGAERVAPAHGESHLNALLRTSESAGRELTNKFYALYADIRQEVFGHLRVANDQVDPQEILRCTQKLLDRILFCSFCEDRVLLPPNTVRCAFEHNDPYNPRPIWDNFRGLFRSVDVGNAGLKIPAYNGGLFAHDAGLDTLAVPDEVCALFRDLADYDYRPAREMADASDTQEIRPVIDVDILGHIFEQSITDLERLRQDLERDDSALADEKLAKTRRKKEGAFYTPAFITRYIVEQTLGAVLRVRFEALRLTEETAATGTAKKTLIDPNAYDLQALNEPQRKALIRFWEQWQEVLKTLRILDPACGSGAFLIEAFDQLHAHYEVSNARLEELRGHRTLFDLDRQILQNNIYGVDLNAEAIQICQLSLWIKTAAHGKRLTSLDHSIREGNSVVSDSTVHPKAFNWQAAFPEVFAQGGFDVVVGNPPYVRQEFLTPYKPWLEAHYASYHGMADLYVYFYELGQRVLKPGGLLSYIVTNKWMKAGYGEPLRRFFRDKVWVRSVVDFGHAKQIFEEADVFPCIIVAEKPTSEEKPKTARLCTIPREQLRIDDLSVQIEKGGADMDAEQLKAEAWQLEPTEVLSLLNKLRQTGKTLKQFVGSSPQYGIKTGFNDAFLIDDATKQRLTKDHESCREIIKPYLRGSDLDRWESNWDQLWMIVLPSSNDYAWPWADLGDSAEDKFRELYPSLHDHMKPHEEALRKRQDKGRHWWELRSCAYWDAFEKPKIFYQEIQFHPSYSLDVAGRFGNNKTFFLSTDDLYLLAVLNSPLMWWHNWRYLPHMKDEALSPVAFKMAELPIAEPTAAIRTAVEIAVSRLIDISDSQQQTQHTVLDWLRVEYAIEKPSQKLAALNELDSDAFVAEVKKLRGKSQPLTAASLAALRAEHTRSIAPARALAAEMLQLERTLSALINQAYGLTPQEVQLMWDTAPPRMPFVGP
ncbi:Eco57I restriction-modification methylase domain-containing protein [Prosthecobacter sp.]|uniref:Eco57I restriction-modification methylase domain-containing protein n=1 Tax=Prosthecobacter sp. TaxID=1965333 RepID=UPI003783197A